MSLDAATTIRINSRVLHRELDGESVLLELESGRYFGLDEVGTRIWSLLVEDGRLGSVIDRLDSEYDVPTERLRVDVSAFVELLLDQGLLDIDPS